MSKNSGLRKACLYALPPHQLGYCGPQEKKKSSMLSDFIGGEKTDKKKIKSILEKEFIVSGYYKIIAQTHKLDLFDVKVIEAYWTGNELLDKFFKTGKIIPYHLYHVIAVGSISGRIKFNDLKRDQCRINWGKVLKINNSKILVEYQPLKKKNKEFVLDRKIVKQADWDKNFTPKLQIGNIVSIHWNKIIEILSKNKVKQLQHYTKLTLKLCTT